MTSREVEDVHTALLNKLLSDSGLECIKSEHESSETSTTSEQIEETVHHEEEEEQIVEAIIEEETKVDDVEDTQEEQPEIFPTPSLRKVLSEKVRQIEQYNRLHVLPEEFRTDIDPESIPKIVNTAPQKYIDILAEITGCKQYKNSLAEYWFLDTLANLLRRAHEDGMNKCSVFNKKYYTSNLGRIFNLYIHYLASQAVLILWFCEWMKEMQHFDAANRERMMKRFQENMLSAARYLAEEDNIPSPININVHYKAKEPTSQASSIAPNSRHLVTFEGSAFECSLQDLIKILHYIYDLFSTDYQYDLVRSVFTFTPETTLIEAPYQMLNPKRLYAPLKVKPKKEKSPKKDQKTPKGKKKDVDTEEYLALLELRARDEREMEEQEDKDREDWNRRSHILPLSSAADEDLFNKYWPPPPPPEPEPEPEIKVKKGKGKK